MRRFSNAYVYHFLELGCRVGLYCAREIRFKKLLMRPSYSQAKNPVLRGLRALPTTQAIAIGYSILEPSPRP